MDFPVLNIKESPLYTSAYNLGFFFSPSTVLRLFPHSLHTFVVVSFLFGLFIWLHRILVVACRIFSLFVVVCRILSCGTQTLSCDM